MLGVSCMQGVAGTVTCFESFSIELARNVQESSLIKRFCDIKVRNVSDLIACTARMTIRA
jgi:fluoride ion exporter CrcB/FEX